jgi:hypothetical protein
MPAGPRQLLLLLQVWALWCRILWFRVLLLVNTLQPPMVVWVQV